MNSRAHTESIYQLFKQKIYDVAAEVYKPLLAKGIVSQNEVDEEVERYFKSKRTGLQQFYSYYAEQWDCYFRAEEAKGADFLTFLGRLSGSFERQYDWAELNLAYYIQAFKKMSVDTEEWQFLRQVFMERWYNLLSDKDYNFQLMHVLRLCADYHRMVSMKVGELNNVGRGGEEAGARLSWLQVDMDPAVRKAIKELIPLLNKEFIISELLKVLGRENPNQIQRHKAVNDQHYAYKVARSSHSDIRGVTMGNNLNALMPMEYSFMSDGDLENLFLKRYTEKGLQMFESASISQQRAKSLQESGHDISSGAGKGPIVVCVDTSSSMQGRFEMMAKAIVLMLGLCSEQQNRLCRVILFSEQTQCIEFTSMYEGLTLLSDFLCQSFHGGTDLVPMMQDVLETLQQERFAYADLLILSDFEIEEMSSLMRQYFEHLSQRNVEVYGVAFGERANESYLTMCTKYWVYR